MKKSYQIVVMLLIVQAQNSLSFAQTAPVVNNVSIDSFKLKKESRFTFNLHGGYNVGLGSTFKFYPDDVTAISVEVVNNNPSEKQTTYKSTSKGLGDGFRYGAGLSYIWNDFINIGIDIDYFKSTITKAKDSSFTEVNTIIPTRRSYKERYTISYDASLLTITPNIMFKAISRPNFFIYNRVGAVITIRPNSIQKERQDVRAQTGIGAALKDSTAYTEKRYDWGLRNPAFGFMGAVGLQLKLTKIFRAFAELQFSHVVFKVRTRTLTDFNVNGTERMSTLTLSQKETEFEKELTNDELNQTPDQPSKAIVQRFPVTYVGVQAGLVYRF